MRSIISGEALRGSIKGERAIILSTERKWVPADSESGPILIQADRLNSAFAYGWHEARLEDFHNFNTWEEE